jgi:hypothetical protein
VFGIGEMVEMTGKSMSNNRRKSRRPTLRMFEGKIGSERQIEMIPSEPFDLG